jgi:hypothetical protein
MVSGAEEKPMKLRYIALVGVLILALSLLAACTGPGELLGRLPTPTPGSAGAVQLTPGAWGGEHIGLTVTDTGATYEMDCAHGTISGPLNLDSAGHFEWIGTYVQEHGGPIPVRFDTQVQDTHSARYNGSSDGQTLTMTLTLTDQTQQIGSYTLTLGKQPRLIKCK